MVVVEKNVLFVSSAWTDEAKFNVSVKKGAGCEHVYVDNLVYNVNAFRSVSDAYLYTGSTGLSPVSLCVYDKALTAADLTCFADGAVSGDELILSLYSLSENKSGTVTTSALTPQGSFGTVKSPRRVSADYVALTGAKDVFVLGTGKDQVISVVGGSLGVKMNFSVNKSENGKKGTRTETVSFSGKITSTASGALGVSDATVRVPQFSDMYGALYSTDSSEETICSAYCIAAADLSVTPLHSYDWSEAFKNHGDEFCVSSQQTVSLTDGVIGTDVSGGKYSYELKNGTVQCSFSDFSSSIYWSEAEKCAYTEKITRSASGSFTGKNISANKSVWNAEKEIYEPSETEFTQVSGFATVTLDLSSGNTLGSFDSASVSEEKTVSTTDTREWDAGTGKYVKVNRNNTQKITEKTSRKATGSFAVSGVGAFRGSDGADDAVCGYKKVTVSGAAATAKITFEKDVSAGESSVTEKTTLSLKTVENAKKGVTSITETGDYANEVENVAKTETSKASGTLTAENADFEGIFAFDKVFLNSGATAKSVVAGGATRTVTQNAEGNAARTVTYSITDATRSSFDEIYRKAESPVTVTQEIGTKKAVFTLQDKDTEKAGSQVRLSGATVSGEISGYGTVEGSGSKVGSIDGVLETTSFSTEKQCLYDIEIAAGSDTPADVLTSVTVSTKNSEKYSFGTSLKLDACTVSGEVCGYKKVSISGSELKSALKLFGKSYSERAQTISAKTTSTGAESEAETATWKISFPSAELSVSEKSVLGDVSGYATVKIGDSSTGGVENCLSGSETKKIVRTWETAADYEAGASPESAVVESYQGKYSVKGTAKVTGSEIGSDITGYNTVEISGKSVVKGGIQGMSADLTIVGKAWNSFNFTDSGEKRYCYDKRSTEIDAISRTYKEKTEQTGAKSVKIAGSTVSGSVGGYSAVAVTSGGRILGGVSSLSGEYSDAVKELQIEVSSGAANKVQCEYALSVSTTKTDDTVISRTVSVKVTQSSGGSFTLTGQSSVGGDVCGFGTVSLTDGIVGGNVVQSVVTVKYMKDDEFFRSGTPEKTALERYDADDPSVSGTETVTSTVSAGKTTLNGSTVGGNVIGSSNVVLDKGSTVSGYVSGGNIVKTVRRVSGQTVSEKTTFTAAGSLSVKGGSCVSGGSFGYLSVTVTDSRVGGCISANSAEGLVSDKTKTALTLSGAEVSSVLNYKTITVKSGVNYVRGIYADSAFGVTVSVAKKSVLSVASFSRGSGNADYISELSVKGEFDFTGTESDFSGKGSVTVTGTGNVYAAAGVVENRLDLGKFKGKVYSLGAAENAGANFRCTAYEQADDIDEVDIGRFEAGDVYDGWLSAEELGESSGCDGIFNDLTDNLAFESADSGRMVISGFDNDEDVMKLMMDSAQDVVELVWDEQEKTFSCDVTAGETYTLFLSYNGVTAAATNYRVAFVGK